MIVSIGIKASQMLTLIIMIRIWCNYYQMEPKLVPLWILLASTSFVAPFQYVFEGCKLSEATVLAESTLRVRKLNRTVAGLYGNFTLKLDLDESFTVGSDNPALGGLV